MYEPLEDADIASLFNYQALLDAIENHDVARVRELIADGVEVNYYSYKDHGPFALIHAIQCNPDNNEIALALLDAGAAVDLRCSDSGDYTALHYAAGQWNIELMKALLERGADVNATGGEYSYTPLTYFNDTDLGLIEVPEEQVLEGVNLLIAYGADVCASEIQVLHWVAENNFIKVAKRLLEMGADIDAPDPTDYTPFMRSAEEPERFPMMKFLYLSRANIYLKNCNDSTALDMAVHFKNDDAVKFLSARMGPEPTDFPHRDIRFFFPILSRSPTVPNQNASIVPTALNEAAIDTRIRPATAGVEDDSDTEENTNKKQRVG